MSARKQACACAHTFIRVYTYAYVYAQLYSYARMHMRLSIYMRLRVCVFGSATSGVDVMIHVYRSTHSRCDIDNGYSSTGYFI